MVIPCPCWKGQGGAGRECFITRWECLSSVFSACNVLSRSSHLVPITPGIQAAAKLRIAVKHPNKHARKCHTIHHALPMESRALERRHNSSCFFFFFRDTRQQQAGSWLMCCDCRSPCTAWGHDSHGWRPCVLSLWLSWEIGLLSCLGSSPYSAFSLSVRTYKPCCPLALWVVA